MGGWEKRTYPVEVVWSRAACTQITEAVKKASSCDIWRKWVGGWVD